MFLILLLVNGEERGKGSGTRRDIAKDNAADEALAALTADGTAKLEGAHLK